MEAIYPSQTLVNFHRTTPRYRWKTRGSAVRDVFPTVVNPETTVLCGVLPCGFVNKYRHFGGTLARKVKVLPSGAVSSGMLVRRNQTA
jgi:hypothetical protein